MPSRKTKLSLFEAMHRAQPRPGASRPPEPAAPPTLLAYDEPPPFAPMEAEPVFAAPPERAHTFDAGAPATVGSAEPAALAPARRLAERLREGVAVSTDGGRVILSLNTIGCALVAAALTIVAMTSYSVGRHRGADPARDAGPRPLTSIVAPEVSAAPEAPPAAPARPSRPADIDLSRLLARPPVATDAAPPGPEAGSEPEELPPAAANRAQHIAPKPLQLLQIESFIINRPSQRGDVLVEMQDVRRFLSERGVATDCRELSSSLILVSERGFESPTAPGAAAFKREVERLGGEYRRSGGRYEFRGCFYRSAESLPGRPLQ